jgi:hypothetical protein
MFDLNIKCSANGVWNGNSTLVVDVGVSDVSDAGITVEKRLRRVRGQFRRALGPSVNLLLLPNASSCEVVIKGVIRI